MNIVAILRFRGKIVEVMPLKDIRPEVELYVESYHSFEAFRGASDAMDLSKVHLYKMVFIYSHQKGYDAMHNKLYVEYVFGGIRE